MRKWTWGAGAAVATLAGAQLVFATSAQAATGVSTTGGNLRVVAATGVANIISVVQQPTTLLVIDNADTVTPGNGCQAVTASSVSCPLLGVKLVSVTAGDRDDNVSVITRIRATVDGGAGEDVLTGDSEADRLIGGPDNDTLSGGIGDDRLEGGPGEDVVDGGPNNDWAYEESAADGPDSVNGGSGTDAVSYAARTSPVSVTLDGIADDGARGENDNIATDVENAVGGQADDVITGSSATNVLSGGGGRDTLSGLDDPAVGDTLFGGQGTDTLNGGPGSDGLYGGPGDDKLSGGPDNDGAYADSVVDGADDYTGGDGLDSVNYSGRTVRVAVRLDGIANDGEIGENDNNRLDVEQVSGGSGDDFIVGNAAQNVLFGGAGDDTIQGEGDYDYMDGGPGQDELLGGDGTDWLVAIDGVRANDRSSGDGGLDTCDSDPGDIEISC